MARVRDWACDRLGVRAQMAFYQSSWGWAEQYVLDEPHEGALGGVYLVPEPSHARVAICCDRYFFEQHRISDLPKPVQAGIRGGICIGRRVWVECELRGDSDSEGVCELLDGLMAGSLSQ